MPKTKRKENHADCPKCAKDCTSNTDIFWCALCNFQFDDDPDEGGDYDDRNPAARLEREERNKERRRTSRGRR